MQVNLSIPEVEFYQVALIGLNAQVREVKEKLRAYEPTVVIEKTKRTMSAASRRKIGRAVKARWAAKRK